MIILPGGYAVYASSHAGIITISNSSRALAGFCAAFFVCGAAAFGQSAPSTDPTQQPFVCDEEGAGTGSASFVNLSGHFSLQLNIVDSSPVVVGSLLKNVANTPFHSVAVKFRGAVSDSFGPYIVLTYRLPSGKSAGRVVPFDHTSMSTANGVTTASITPTALEIPDGSTIQSLEIIAIGENSAGSVTINDVLINGSVAGKTLSTISSCDAVP